jgi:NAD(P)-dependent dehydrogenase (short-subunit alcohol dehydrogenase family)
MDKGVFLVAGGSRGIGEAIAVEAARAGYKVLLTFVSAPERAEAVVTRIRDEGGTAEAVQADTAIHAEVEKAFLAADRLGPLAALAYNSGITGPASPLAEADPAAIARVLDVNLFGAMLCAREAIRRMSTRRGGQGGSIILLSSRASFYGSPGEYVWYSASKGGVDSLVNGLSREVGLEGIRVNAVSPGPIDTTMLSAEKAARAAGLSPLGRIGLPEEVAAAVLFLASDKASYISGANLAVSGAR